MSVHRGYSDSSLDLNAAGQVPASAHFLPGQRSTNGPRGSRPRSARGILPKPRRMSCARSSAPGIDRIYTRCLCAPDPTSSPHPTRNRLDVPRACFSLSQIIGPPRTRVHRHFISFWIHYPPPLLPVHQALVVEGRADRKDRGETPNEESGVRELRLPPPRLSGWAEGQMPTPAPEYSSGNGGKDSAGGNHLRRP